MSTDGPTDDTTNEIELPVIAPDQQHNDRPREQILQMAEWAINQGHRNLYFQFNCEHCKARNTFGEPNMLYETGVCSNCGEESKVKEAGFMTVYEMVKPAAKKGRKKK